MRYLNFFLLLSFVYVFTSCKPKADLNYMQDAEEVATNAAIANTSSVIQPGDQLGIWVSAQDMEAVIPFNQNFSQSQNVQYNTGNTNSTPLNNTSQVPTYTVRTDNTINFPVIGSISTENQTVESFTKELENQMKKFIFEPTVNVKTMNYKVTILGEVARPGTFTLPDGQATVLSALGLAGDLTKYAERNNVLIVRNENGTITKHRFDITRSDFINSPYYYLKQNDVIYVNSNKTVAKQSVLDPNTTIYISVASIVVTILALVFKK